MQQLWGQALELMSRCQIATVWKCCVSSTEKASRVKGGGVHPFVLSTKYLFAGGKASRKNTKLSSKLKEIE